MSDQVTKKLIFLFPYGPTAWDAERFGFQFFLDKGIALEIFDMSNIISSRNSSPLSLQEKYIKKIASLAHFETELKHQAHTAIFIDGINGLNGFQWQGRHIFRLLKQYHANYCLVEIGSLPLLSTNQPKKIISKLKKALHLRKLFTYIKWKLGKYIVNFQATYFHYYQLPDKIFVGNTDLLAHYLRKYQLSVNSVVPIHSFDYDRYITYSRKNHEANEATKTCVFLDQALLDHSDFGSTVSFSPVTADKYVPCLNQFFEKVEQETGLEIVIAASPRSTSPYLQNMFGNRQVIKGNTLELVAKCDLVLMHSSTAVSFAVLFNKPIIVMKTNEMANAHGYGNFIDNMAFSLNLTPVYIDRKQEVDRINIADYKKWKINYDEYKYKYIMSKDLVDKTMWEIVVDELDFFHRRS